MKKALSYIPLILLLAACHGDRQSVSDQMAPLFPGPKVVALNTEEGYSVNQLTGDSIQSLTIGGNGGALISGQPIPVEPNLFPIDPSSEIRRILAKPPKKVITNTHIHEITVQPTIVPINRAAQKIYRPGVDSIDIPETTPLWDTLLSGASIPAKGKVVPTIYPQPLKALPPRFKDGAINDIKYLDVDNGLSSSLLLCMLEDRRGDIWFGMNVGGICKYDGENFTHYTKKEGLFNNAVHSMLEDKNGNIWFGGRGNGVCMFDGEKFTHYTGEGGFPCTWIESIIEDKNGNIWFGTNCGAIKFDGKNFTRFTQKEGLRNDQVEAILEDKSGTIWFSSSAGGDPAPNNLGVCSFDGEKFIHFTKREGFTSYDVLCMLEDKNGNLWFGTKGEGAIMYDGKQFVYYTVAQGLSHNIVESIFEDKKGNLWFGTRGGGVNRFDGRAFTHFTEKEGLSSNVVMSISEDKSGNLWFCTEGGGVSIYKEGSFRHFKEKESLFDGFTLSMMEDKSGNLWFSTFGGGGIQYDGSGFLQYTSQQGQLSDRVNSILEDKEGNYWFITKNEFGVGKYDGKLFSYHTGRPYQWIDNGWADKNGNFWFGMKGGALSRFDGKNFAYFPQIKGFAGTAIQCIFEDRSGNIWVGSNRHGVGKFDGKNFIQYTEKEGLSSNSVLSIVEDKRGNIWFGTAGGGVNKFDGKRFTYYTEREGLIDNRAWRLLEDDQGNIWAGTEKGISCLRVGEIGDRNGSGKGGLKKPSEVSILNFSSESGLKGLKVASVYLDRKNRVWWGISKSLTMLDLNAFSFPDHPPVVRLDHVEINEQFFDYRNDRDSLHKNIKFSGVARFSNYPLDLELPYHQNHLVFYFSAIDWAAPHEIRYSYRIEELDAGWSKPAKEAKADFRNLPYGTFTLKVQAIGTAQIWSDPFEYTFTILPPWWHTWWARALYVLFALGAVIAYVQWRTRSLKKQKAVLEQTVTDRTVELRKQKDRAEQSEKFKEMFLANMSHEIRTPMHAISGMTNILIRNKHLKTQDKFLSAIQRSSRNLLVILNDILDLSKIEAGKIEIERIPISPAAVIDNVVETIRFKAEEKGLSLETSIGEGVPEHVYGDPTRLSQILLNLLGNAIKFTERGKVSLHLTEEDNKLRFSVQDTGIGIPSDKLERIFGSFEQVDESTTRKYGGTGLGLSISQQLVTLQKGRIWVESQENVGSTFIFELPLVRVEAGKKLEKQLSEAQLKEMAAAISGLKILLAEDNAFNVMVATDDLEYYIPGIEIDVAENGRVAVEKFQSGNYDIILMDIQMPELSGLDASKEIRKIESSTGSPNPIPIIAMTASLLKSEIDQCFEAGMNNYVPKPYKFDELIGTIHAEIKKAQPLWGD